MVDYSEQVTGAHVDEVRSLGGASKSAIWCQIKADVLGRRVVTMRNTQDAAAMGAALLAGVGVGLWPSVAEVAREFAEVDRVYEPNPDNREAYESALHRYDLLTHAMHPISREVY